MKVWFPAFVLSASIVCGCTDVNEPAPQQQPTPTPNSTPSTASGHEQSPSQTTPTQTTPSTSSIPKEDGRLVDMQAEQAKNPDLVVVDGKIKGSDPISAAGSAYVSMTSGVQAQNMQHNVRIMQAEKGRPLTFDEFQGLAKQLNIQFNKMPPYRMFGYDSKTGEVVVLEDKAMKKKIYEEKGIPWDE